MKLMRILLGLAALAAAVPVSAQVVSRDDAPPTPGVVVVTASDGKRVSLPATVNVDGTGAAASGTPTGTAGSPNANVVSVQGITGGTPQRVAGTSLSGATDDGSAPNKIGGVYSTSFTSFSAGQRADAQADQFGNLRSRIVVGTNAGTDAISNATVGFAVGSNSASSLVPIITAGIVFNGTSWDRQRGDTNGSYVVPKGIANLATAQISVATTATLIVAARTGRSRLMITQSAAGPCYYGATSAVTASTGARLTAAGASKTYQYAGALYGICPGGAVTTDVDEEY